MNVDSALADIALVLSSLGFLLMGVSAFALVGWWGVGLVVGYAGFTVGVATDTARIAKKTRPATAAPAAKERGCTNT